MKFKNSAGRIDSVSIIAWVTMVLLAIPIFYILIYGFLIYGSAVARESALFRSIELTIISSAISAAIVFMIFTPLAFDLSRKQNSLLESASDIPASIPHPIVGIAFLILASPITPFGSFLYSIGINLYNSFLGLIVVLSFVSAPVYIRSAQSVFSAMNRHHEMLGYSLGSSRLSVLYSIVVPSNLKDLVSATLTAMSRAMSEFGSVAILTY
ncbi:MAG: ABC transporter permease subunit, partial [Thermoplasmataceae archaeon]